MVCIKILFGATLYWDTCCERLFYCIRDICLCKRTKIKFVLSALLLQENNINPRVYSGLANYAAKVVKKTPADPTVHQQHNYGASSLAGTSDGITFEDPSLAAVILYTANIFQLYP